MSKRLITTNGPHCPILVVLTQTTGLLNHLKPLLCYVMLYPNFITFGPVTPVVPLTVTDALLLLLLVFCDICSSSLSLSFESLDSIIISNFNYYFQDGRPTRYYNRRTGTFI